MIDHRTSTQRPLRTGRPAGTDFGARTMLTVGFTGVQAWAIAVAITQIHVAGTARFALAFALAAAAIAVLDGWLELITTARGGGSFAATSPRPNQAWRNQPH